MGIPYAKVLPVPVGALAITSCQSIMGGMQPACTGVVMVICRWAMALAISGDRPKLSNRTPSVYSIVSYLLCHNIKFHFILYPENRLL